MGKKVSWRWPAMFYAVLFVVMGIPINSSAATLDVCPSGCTYSTIQSAIDAAQDGDIVLVGDGTYNENLNYWDKSITVKSVNGAASTIINGGGTASVVYLFTVPDGNNKLEGFTITNGNSGYGGGIYAYTEGNTEISNCIIDNNISSNGGGICCDGPVKVTSCTISNNFAFVGSGVYCYDSPIFSDCVITSNTTSGYELGAGIFFDTGSAKITNSTISNNQKKGVECGLWLGSPGKSSPTISNCNITGNSGMGIYASQDCSLTITNSTVSSNNDHGICISGKDVLVDNCVIRNNVHDWYGTGIPGAGISIIDSLPEGNPTVVQNSIISSNTAVDQGGGIFIDCDASPTISNCIIKNNTFIDSFGGYGAGIACAGVSSPTIVNSTIYSNKNGAGIEGYHSSTTTVLNSIIWGNTWGIWFDEFSSSVDVSYSNVQDGDLTNPGSLYPGIGNIDLDPAFVDPLNGDLHLSAVSPCIDTGISSGAPSKDIDGDSRPVAFGYDMGADERVSITCTDIDSDGFYAQGGCGTVIDCDDNNAAVTTGETWYKDADKDGYSDGTTKVQCARPIYYYLASELIATSGDCNDTSGEEYPGQSWYKDADKDHYHDGTVLTQCEYPGIDYFTVGWLSGMEIDCDDTNRAIHPNTTWYKDQDGDDYSDGSTMVQCPRPANYNLASELTATSGDCDDSNAEINPTTVWYRDYDGDGYSDGTHYTQCNPPASYFYYESQLIATSGDCDDSNAEINPATTWYKDQDGDGYSDGTTQAQCTRPTYYYLAGELTATSGDCDDIDPGLNPETVWYKDQDGDGYSDGAYQVQCTRPTNHYLASELISIDGDCNDNDAEINPGACDIKNDGIDQDCDGEDRTKGKPCR